MKSKDPSAGTRTTDLVPLDPAIPAASAGGAGFAAVATILELREKLAARLVEALLPPADLVSIGPDVGLQPLPGKRFKTMSPADHALMLVRAWRAPSRQQSEVHAKVIGRVPAPLVAGGPDCPAAVPESLAGDWAAWTPEHDRVERVRALLALALDPARKDLVARLLESDYLAPTPSKQLTTTETIPTDPKDVEIRRLEQKIAKLEVESRAIEAANEDRERSLKLRIDLLQTESTELQARLGKRNREYDELHQLYDTVKADCELAFRRAARFKQSLDETKAPSDRERDLHEAWVREKQRADIEASKVEILEYELDILAQDDAVESEPNATAAANERNPARERVQNYVARGGPRPRVLVVGGAGKQRSHRERDFEEMKRRLEIDGEWRFADYGSWHRELPRLRNDIQHRFDLVFVLHWNRTTFVQKMHDEARALNGRVRTVPYRGFLSLERAILEEVDRFVQERI